MRLILPYPPSINQYYRVLPKGRVLISKRGRLYRSSVIDLIKRRYPYVIESRDRLDVRIELQPPDRRRRDLDNVLKPLLDSMTYAHVWADDSQIDILLIERGEVCRGGCVIVTIESCSGRAAGTTPVPTDDLSGCCSQTGIQSQPSRQA